MLGRQNTSGSLNRGTQETGRENLDFMCEAMQLIDYALDTGVS